MRSLAALSLALALAAAPAWADDAGADRSLSVTQAAPRAVGASYGPFRVLDDRRAALVDATDAASPGAFAAMLRDHPALATLEMVECPGTDDDVANLQLGRMIRAAGIATHVPRGGSVRSGAVELFLAGARRAIDDGAEFAVHSWRDDGGHEARDFAAEAPENRAYLVYYREMGMTAEAARAFYDMTNSVPNADARWLSAQDMRGWIREAAPAARVATAPKIAYAGF